MTSFVRTWCSVPRIGAGPAYGDGSALTPSLFIPLADWPLALPLDWLEIVNRPQSAGELEALRRSVNRDAPYGDSAWQRATAARYNLEHTLRPRGRPRKGPTPSLLGPSKNEACPLCVRPRQLLSAPL